MPAFYRSVRCGESFPVRLVDVVRKFVDSVLVTEAHRLDVLKTEVPGSTEVHDTAFVKESGSHTRTR